MEDPTTEDIERSLRGAREQHLSDEEQWLYVTDDASDLMRARVEAHTAICFTCRDSLSVLATPAEVTEKDLQFVRGLLAETAPSKTTPSPRIPVGTDAAFSSHMVSVRPRPQLWEAAYRNSANPDRNFVWLASQNLPDDHPRFSVEVVGERAFVTITADRSWVGTRVRFVLTLTTEKVYSAEMMLTERKGEAVGRSVIEDLELGVDLPVHQKIEIVRVNADATFPE